MKFKNDEWNCHIMVEDWIKIRMKVEEENDDGGLEIKLLSVGVCFITSHPRKLCGEITGDVL